MEKAAQGIACILKAWFQISVQALISSSWEKWKFFFLIIGVKAIILLYGS